MEFNYQDIKRLAEILRPAEEDSDSEDDLPQSGLSALGNAIKHGLFNSTLFIITHIIPKELFNLKRRVTLSLCLMTVILFPL
jgi:hypothetical protein